MPQVALDKKSNFEYLEKEIGFKRFLPKSVIDSMKVRTFCFILQNFWAEKGWKWKDCVLKKKLSRMGILNM